MALPAAIRLLEAWEHGLSQNPAQRAITMLAAAMPGASPESIARLSIGGRDSRLCALRIALFGSNVAGVAACPACTEPVELAFDITALIADREQAPVEPLMLVMEGYEIRFRLPNGGDVIALAQRADAEPAAAELLARCLLGIELNGTTVAAGRLPEPVADAVIKAMAEAEPPADVQIAVSCPLCGHAWSAPFDIGDFLWKEIHAWAGRMLYDVHLLASRYHWSESAILSMSAARRQRYLDMDHT